MKRKEIKQLLNRQLDEITPAMSDKVKRTPLKVVGDETAKSKSAEKVRKGFVLPKWAYAVACVAVVIVIAMSCGLYYGLKPAGENGAPQTVCYIVDINPSIVITADKNGKVTHISSQNQDGDVVLSSSAFDNYVNMSVEECVNAIIEQSAKLGYIDCNSKDNKVTLTLVGDDASNAISIDAIADKAQNFLRELNVFGFIDTAVSDVKSYVQSNGWEYTSSRLDAYMDNIILQSKFVLGAEYGGDFGKEAEKYLGQYYQGIVEKKTLLERLGAKLEDIVDIDGNYVNYWIYKKVEGTFLAPKLSADSQAVVKECDAIVASLSAYGIDVSSSAQYGYYVAKYAIAEELGRFFEEVKNFIYDSEFFNLFLSIVDDEDRHKFEVLQEQLNGYYNDVVVQLNKQFDERIDKYLDIFERRPAISDKEYDEYLQGVSR
ncbi:MAG: hypothetical protein K2L70_05175 [Clostridia bacterium]|nr:hypothetical protein [Clostridia bacterium]